MEKTLRPGTREIRRFAIERSAVDTSARTVELSFSSEISYERWWGIEILDHSPQSVRLGRLAGGGPLLVDHDSRDHIGVIESVQIGADRVGRAMVRFGKSARAEEVFTDVADGIRRNVSVGYVIHRAVLQEQHDETETYRVTDWEPFEISIVSVPADPSVGVGRSDQDPRISAAPIVEPASTRNESRKERIRMENTEEHRAAGAADERKRVQDIIQIGEQYKLQDLASEHCRRGASVAEFQAAAIATLATRAKPVANIGLTDEEIRSFSVLRAINALANPTDRKAQEAAAFERAASDAVAQKMGRAAQGFFVPFDVQTRDLLVGTATAGGNTVATNLLAQNFIDLLRNKLAVLGLGAQMLTGLVGNIAIPRQTGGAAAYWVAENGAPTESQQAFDQVTMAPKTVGAFSDISRKLLLQSSIDVEGFVRNDLATIMALAIDLAAVNGSGASNQPTGVLNAAGIGSVAGGANGAIPTWGNIVDLESAVATANADVGTLGYLTNTKVRGKLKQVSKVSGQNGFVWDDGGEPLNGYRAQVSNQVPGNLTKGTSSGVCSAILFGNWADLIIGQWGTLDLMVDPYTGSTAGTVRVVALQDVDIAVRHTESFAAMKDALTA